MDELGQLFEHGVFLRRHALEHGYDDRALRRGVTDGTLKRIRQGAYVAATVWDCSDSVAQHILRCHSVAMSHQVEVAFSHVSGSLLHGLGVWGSDLSRVHVTRLGVAAARKHHDVAYHETAGSPKVLRVAGVDVLGVEYCAIGTAAMSSVEAGMVVLDSAYRLGCEIESMRAAAEAMHRWPGSARLQVTLRLASPGAESVGESRARYLFWSQHIPRPTLQHVVMDGDQVAGITDFAWPEYKLLGEFDGRVKYGRLVRPGESAGDAVFREKVREDRLRELTGWRFVRLTWADLGAPLRTADRVRSALLGRIA